MRKCLRWGRFQFRCDTPNPLQTLSLRNSTAEIFFQSPLPEDHQPRANVVSAYLDYAESQSDANSWAGSTMVGMTFYASPEQQWDLILELINKAPDSENVLQTIAAGPLEGYLGRFGDSAIDDVESLAASDAKFARVLSGVWQHGMSNSVWQRVRKIQRTVPNPLPEMKPFS